MMKPWGVVMAGALVASCTGCGTGGEREGAAAVVSAFFTAIEAKDGQRACELLLPQARSGLETGDAVCEQEVLTLELEGGALGRPQVWNGNAQVRAGEDTVFLARWGEGWKITAAGCEPRAGRPYDCEVQA